MKNFMNKALISVLLVCLCLSCAQSHKRGNRRQRQQSQKILEDEGDIQDFVMEKVNKLCRSALFLYLRYFHLHNNLTLSRARNVVSFFILPVPCRELVNILDLVRLSARCKPRGSFFCSQAQQGQCIDFALRNGIGRSQSLCADVNHEPTGFLLQVHQIAGKWQKGVKQFLTELADPKNKASLFPSHAVHMKGPSLN
jgi:hypothetical protein